MIIHTTIAELYITKKGRKGKERILIPQDEIEVVAGRGVRGDRHFGSVMSSTVRDRNLFKVLKGIPVFNWRQIAITTVNEHAEIAQAIGVDPMFVTGKELFSNIVLANVPGFTQLPPFTMISFAVEGRPILLTTLENNPCSVIAAEIAQSAEQPNVQGKVVKVLAKMHKRGLMAVAYTWGKIKVKDVVTITTPDEYMKNMA